MKSNEALIVDLSFNVHTGTVRVELSWSTELPGGKEVPKKGEKTFALKNGDQVSFDQFGYLQLSVSDTGAGMSEDQMASVFQQGTQFNGKRKEPVLVVESI